MYSFSKITLNHERAQSIVSAHFGAQRRLLAFHELKEGYYNAAALLELDDGLKCVLKAAPPDEVKILRYEKDIMQTEVSVMRLVRAQTEVPCPQVYYHDTSRSLLESDFFIMEFLPGTPFHKLRRDFTPDAQARIERGMGRIARQINKISGPTFGYFAKPEQPGCSWRDCFGNMLRDLLLDGWEAGVTLPLAYDELFQRLEAHFDALDEVETPCLVHWDLWDGNIFVDPQTRKITGVIDYERALWGDPLIEFIFSNLDPTSPYVQGYRTNLLATPDQRRRRLLYNAYLYLIMVIECAFRKYETQDQENWARPRLEETLSKLKL
jgi:aminoglycoside phosphotransferase (APT) family kinase protein